MFRKDFTLYIGETWTIDGVVNDGNGAPVNLTGGAVEMRIASPTALAIKLSGSDISIDSGANGTYTITMDATDARHDALAPGDYAYEVESITASGAVSVQNAGKVRLYKSLRKAYP